MKAETGEEAAEEKSGSYQRLVHEAWLKEVISITSKCKVKASADIETSVLSRRSG